MGIVSQPSNDRDTETGTEAGAETETGTEAGAETEIAETDRDSRDRDKD